MAKRFLHFTQFRRITVSILFTMKLAILSALLASASAFSPVQQAAKTTCLAAGDYSDELGVQQPVS